MAIQYDFYKNPPQNGEEETRLLHPRPVVFKTIKTKDLAVRISARSSFSSADLKGILDNLAEELYRGLENGCNVYIEGIGTFSVSLESRHVEDPSEIRGNSIHVKGINFRPDKQLKQKLKTAKIERVKRPRKQEKLTEEKRLKRIEWYVNRYGSINVTTAIKLNHTTHKITKVDLQKMVDQGSLKRVTYGNFSVYLSNS